MTAKLIAAGTNGSAEALRAAELAAREAFPVPEPVRSR